MTRTQNPLAPVADAIDKRMHDALALVGMAYIDWRESGFDENAGANGLEEAYREFKEAEAAHDGKPAPVWDEDSPVQVDGF